MGGIFHCCCCCRRSNLLTHPQVGSAVLRRCSRDVCQTKLLVRPTTRSPSVVLVCSQYRDLRGPQQQIQVLQRFFPSATWVLDRWVLPCASLQSLTLRVRRCAHK